MCVSLITVSLYASAVPVCVSFRACAILLHVCAEKKRSSPSLKCSPEFSRASRFKACVLSASNFLYSSFFSFTSVCSRGGVIMVLCVCVCVCQTEEEVIVEEPVTEEPVVEVSVAVRQTKGLE